jgi:hypothetical protein
MGYVYGVKGAHEMIGRHVVFGLDEITAQQRIWACWTPDCFKLGGMNLVLLQRLCSECACATVLLCLLAGIVQKGTVCIKHDYANRGMKICVAYGFC